MKVRFVKEYYNKKDAPKVGEIGELIATKVDYEGDERVFVKFPSQNNLITVLYVEQIVSED